MKSLLKYAPLVCLVGRVVAAQDQLTYQPPRGWISSRDQNGLISIAPPGVRPPQLCAMMVYRPEAFGGTPLEFHQAVVRRSMTNSRVLESSPQGAVGAFQVTNVHQQMANGVQFWTRVYTARWADRGQSFILIGNGPQCGQYAPAADSMMSRIAISQSAPSAPATQQAAAAPATSPVEPPSQDPVPGASSFGDYSFAVPAGWTTQPSGNGLWIASPQYGGERCTIGVWPMVASSGNLSTDAQQAWARVFTGLQIRPDDPLNKTVVTRGVAPQGFEYITLRRPIVSPSDPQNSSLGGTVMVANLGNRIAVLSFFSGDPSHSACYQYGYSFHPEVWPRFFASLRFRNWRPASTDLATRVQGSWQAIGTSTGGGAIMQYAFSPAGRYAFTGVGQRYMALSDFTAAVWTSTTFGDGSYVVRGNEIQLKSDKGELERYLFTLEQVSEDAGRTWTEKLFLMQPTRVSTIDGATVKDNEVAYERRK